MFAPFVVADALSALTARATRRMWPNAVGPADVPRSSTRILVLGAWIAAAAFVVQAVTHLAVYKTSIWTLNADHENTVWTWAASSATFAAAVGAVVLLAVWPAATTWLAALAATLFFFSLDDAIGLHEKIVHSRVDAIGPFAEGARIVWPILYSPLLVGVFILLWTLGSVLPRRAARPVQGGLLLLAAAMVFEVVTAFFVGSGEHHHLSFAYNAEVAVEEGFELAGWILIATGLLASGIAWAPGDTRGREAEKEGFEPSKEGIPPLTP